MVAPNLIQPLLKKIQRAAADHLWLWFIPTVAFTLFASLHCVARQPTWQARQRMLVRDESSSGEGGQGRFDSADTMKTAQETILEVSQSRVVVEATLQDLGRPPDRSPRIPWPTDDDVEEMRQRILVTPPQGAEFGSTEVIYVVVTGPSKEEALRRTTTFCDRLEQRLAHLRGTRAESLITELSRTAADAQTDLAKTTTQLQKLEQQLGPDLAELRSLNDRAGEGNLQRALGAISIELRAREAEHQSIVELRRLLIESSRDTASFLATPSSLLDSQPSLRRLKEGLIDAQLRTAVLLGSMRKEHPRVVAALRSEHKVRENLQRELAAAVQGADSDLNIKGKQIAKLQQQQSGLKQRFDRLATVRVHYGNLVSTRDQRSRTAQQAEQKLALARARQIAAGEASLLTRVDPPEVGNKPLGPSNRAIVLAGLGGGLATGVSLVFFALPSGPSNGERRRWSDYVGFGRRASDQASRRSTDPAVAQRHPVPVAPPPVEAAPHSETVRPAGDSVQHARGAVERRESDVRAEIRRAEEIR